jgi:transcriptional regulator with XRE-family HTH domain
VDTSGTGRFAALMDRWRQSRGVDHARFASSLGQSKSGWSHIHHGRRPVPRGMAARVLATAEEPWRSAFEHALAADLEERGRSTAPHTPTR